MCGRTFLRPLALLVIFVANACFAGTHDNLQAAQNKILALIEAGDFAAANMAIEQIKTALRAYFRHDFTALSIFSKTAVTAVV